MAGIHDDDMSPPFILLAAATGPSSGSPSLSWYRARKAIATSSSHTASTHDKVTGSSRLDEDLNADACADYSDTDKSRGRNKRGGRGGAHTGARGTGAKKNGLPSLSFTAAKAAIAALPSLDLQHCCMQCGTDASKKQ